MGFNALKSAVLLAALTGIALAIGQVLGGQQGMLIAFGFAAVMNVFSYWFSDKIVLKMYRAQEVDESTAPRLVGMVRRLSQRARLPMPKVYVIPSGTPNAFATGRNPAHGAVAATTALMDMLSDEELEGVMAHELAHIQHRDILLGTIVATVAGAISMVAGMLRWSLILGTGRGNDDGPHPAALLATAIVAPLMAFILQMAISRSREYMADARGAEISGNPLALATALEKIAWGVDRRPMENTPGRQATAHMMIASPFRGRDVLAMLSTHPPVEERIKRLRSLVRGAAPSGR